MRARELAIGTYTSIPMSSERRTTDVQILLWAQLMMALLLMFWVPRNRTHVLVDRRRYAPQLCFTYHPILVFFYALCTIACYFVRGGVNGK